MDAIILAAGRSQRFGQNKLLVEFGGKTLINWNLEFLKMNDIFDGNIIIVINRKDVETIGYNVVHPIIESVKRDYMQSGANIKFVFQDDEEYGPGAGIRAAAPYITDDYVILFGDNFLWGKFDKDFHGKSAVATYRYLPYSDDNLRLGYIKEEDETFKIIEKPHDHREGTFFCGFTMYKKHTIENANLLKPSVRNEYEISEFFNMAKDTNAMHLDVNWIDITYKEDIEKAESYIKQTLK